MDNEYLGLAVRQDHTRSVGHYLRGIHPVLGGVVYGEPAVDGGLQYFQIGPQLRLPRRLCRLHQLHLRQIRNYRLLHFRRLLLSHGAQLLGRLRRSAGAQAQSGSRGMALQVVRQQQHVFHSPVPQASLQAVSDALTRTAHSQHIHYYSHAAQGRQSSRRLHPLTRPLISLYI